MPVPRAIERAAASAQSRDEALSAKHNYFTNRTRALPLLWYATRVPLLPLFALRLLALEVYESLNLDGTPCSLLTGQERRQAPFAGHVSCTVEMLGVEERVDCAVIDEIQLIGDEFRGASWTRAVLGVPAAHVHLCGDPSAVPVVAALCAITGDDFEVKTYERMTSISPQEASLKGLLGKDAVQYYARSQ